MRKTSKSTSGSRKRSRKSAPPRSAAAVVLAAFAEVVAKRKLRWYLFGAQAVAIYGVARTSGDVDVTIELGKVAVRSFVKDMLGAGFVLRVPDVDGFVASTRVLPFTHVGSAFPVDVVLAGPGLEDAFLDAVREMPFEDLKVPVLSPEDLVVTKILAGRPKDLEDVRGILRNDTVRIDARRVRELLSTLQEALGASDLLPRLDELTKKRRIR